MNGTVGSLFSGCGGLDLGLHYAGLEILAGLNPYGFKRGKPRYFRSGRKIARRPQGRKGAVVECGTATMYRHGCRCWRCRHAQSVRRKYQRLRGIG